MAPIDQDIYDLKVDKDLFGGSYDHYAIVFEIETEFETDETQKTRRVTTKENWDKFLDYLIKEQIMKNCPRRSSKEMTQYIADKIMEAYDYAIPIVPIKPPPPGGYLQWETKKFIKKATRLRRKLRGLDPDSDEYIQLKAKLKILNKCCDNMIKRDRVVDQIRRLETSKDKKKNLYAHVKAAKGKSTNTGTVKDSNGILRSSNQEMATAFGEHLGNQLLSDERPNIDWSTPHPDSPEETTKLIFVTKEAVKLQIRKARKQAAPGPDGIPMEAFSVACDVLSEPLAALFNLVNQTGEVPEMLHKKNEKSNMVNYRPLSMSNHVGKIWERVVNTAIIDHLEANNLLSHRQHGFRRKRGTATNLTQLWEKIIDTVESEGALVELWNFDLTKAFDLLDHVKVFDLLHKAGIYGKLGLSIQNWLVDRTQYVEIGTSKSEKTNVRRSCVQGSVLGPTLWLIYIQSLTDLLDKMNIEYFAYADDLSIVYRIRTDLDRLNFEAILETLQNWADNFDMRWSPQRMVFRYQNCREPYPPKEIYFGGNPIIPLEIPAIFLGVLINKTCTFLAHIKKVADQVKAITALVKQNFANITLDLLKELYQVYVMPTLTYCSNVWNSGDEVQLRAIERAVELFWRLSPTGGPPKDFIGPRLQFIIIDLNNVKKLYDRKTVLNFDEIFKTPVSSNSRSNEDETIGIQRFKLKLARHRFSYRTKDYWNLLPKNIRHMPYGSFKNETKKYVTENDQAFLNFGNKDKIVGQELVRYVKLLKKAKNEEEKSEKWENITIQKRLKRNQ